MLFAAICCARQCAIENHTENKLFERVISLRRLQRNVLIVRVVVVNEFARDLWICYAGSGLVCRIYDKRLEDGVERNCVLRKLEPRLLDAPSIKNSYSNIESSV